MKYVAMLIPLLLPVAGFAIALRLGRGRLVAGVAGSALGGAITGAFFGSAAGAMATAVTSGEALAKGGLIGLGLGAGLGLVLAGGVTAVRRYRATGVSIAGS